MKNKTQDLLAGFIGACALNVIHEAGKKLIPNSPQVDQIAMRAIDKALRTYGIKLSPEKLRAIAFAGDIVSNSLYYAAIAKGSDKNDPKAIWKKAFGAGLSAGIGAVTLPPKMGLGQQPTRNFPVTASLTVAWYLIGALATAGAATLASKSFDQSSKP